MRRWVRWLIAVVVLIGVVAGSLTAFRDEIFRRQSKLPEFTHEFGGSEDVFVPMRDGVKLHTEVFRPRGVERAPVIFVRLPYEFLRPLERLHCLVLTRYGYACVLQDVRGQLESEGVWEPIIHERDDGLDALQWLVKQPFVDGNIAMRGPSYLTCTQLLVADQLPPEVKTLVPSVFGVDFRMSAYERGLLRHDLLTAWATLMPERGMRVSKGREYLKVAAYRPALEADEKIIGKVLPWYRDVLLADEPSSAYWQSATQLEVRGIPERAKVPMLFVAAFFDPFFTAQLDTWNRLATKDQSVLVIGPWNHLNMTSGDISYDVDTGRFDPWPLMLEWFDHHLKGKPLSTLKPGTVRTLGPGDSEWQTYSSWPQTLPLTSLHLGDGAKANDCAGGTLAARATATSDVQYVFDPANPVPTRGGASLLAFAFFRDLRTVPGPVEQGDSCTRDDVLTFKAEPFTERTRLSGAGKLTLEVHSTAPDTAFVARLIAEEDGKAVLVREASATLAFPTSADQTRRVHSPGTPVQLELDFWPMEWVFKKGTRLRLDLTSSSFPALSVHSNRAGPWATQTGADVATETVSLGDGRAVLSLPLKRVE